MVILLRIEVKIESIIDDNDDEPYTCSDHSVYDIFDNDYKSFFL